MTNEERASMNEAFLRFIFLAGFKKGVEATKAKQVRFSWEDALGFGFWAFVFMTAGVHIGINLR